MCLEEAAEELRVRPFLFERWIEAGAPHQIKDGQIYVDPDEVQGWLSRDEGRVHYSPSQRTATAKEVARALQVDVTTVRHWRLAGAPHRVVKTKGKRSRYYFNIEELRRWRRERGKKNLAAVKTGKRNSTLAETAEALGVSEATIRKWITFNAPHDFRGGQYFFNIDELRAWRGVDASASDVRSRRAKKKIPRTRRPGKPKRDLSSQELVDQLPPKYGITTVKRLKPYLARGAPHTKQRGRHRFNLQEFVDWLEAPRLRLIAAAQAAGHNRITSRKEVREEYPTGYQTIDRWVDRGAPHFMFEGEIYFDLEELRAWVTRRTAEGWVDPNNVGERNLPAREIASILDVTIRVIEYWVGLGAPRDLVRASGARGGFRNYFNLQELVDWLLSELGLDLYHRLPS